MGKVILNGIEYNGGMGSNVSWNQIETVGTKIAEIDINGTTTDVYAPNGGSSGHDYSTTEQVVGKWINGKPLYEITYEANSGRGTYNDFLPSDFEDVIIHFAFIKSFNNTIWSSPYYASASDWWGYYFENRKLIVRGSTSLPINTLRVIVQYTKTTDV